jgi:hypothetical protein
MLSCRGEAVQDRRKLESNWRAVDSNIYDVPQV